MIALVIGSSTVTALILGWYGHKAYIRIQGWGEKMNERDAIFQSCASVEYLETTAATSSDSYPSRTLLSVELH